MITQLQLLEQTVVELKERYHITATELVSLKNKISQDSTPQKLTTAQANLTQANDTIATLQATNRDLEAQLAELYEKNQRLSAQNQELVQKNNLAMSRAQLVQDWLAKIDSADA